MVSIPYFSESNLMTVTYRNTLSSDLNASFFSLNSFGLTAMESVVEVMQVSATLGGEREK